MKATHGDPGWHEIASDCVGSGSLTLRTNDGDWTHWVDHELLHGDDHSAASYLKHHPPVACLPSAAIERLVLAGWHRTLDASLSSAQGSWRPAVGQELLGQAMESLLAQVMGMARACQAREPIDDSLREEWRGRCAILRRLVQAGADPWLADPLTHRSVVDVMDSSWNDPMTERTLHVHPWLTRSWSWDMAWLEAMGALLDEDARSPMFIQQMFRLHHGGGGQLRPKLWRLLWARHEGRVLDKACTHLLPLSGARRERL